MDIDHSFNSSLFLLYQSTLHVKTFLEYDPALRSKYQSQWSEIFKKVGSLYHEAVFEDNGSLDIDPEDRDYIA